MYLIHRTANSKTSNPAYQDVYAIETLTEVKELIISLLTNPYTRTVSVDID